VLTNSANGYEWQVVRILAGSGIGTIHNTALRNC
jgi:hypothetical protein